MKRIERIRMDHHYIHMYLNDKDFRAKVSLYIGFTLDCIYVLFKCGSGIIYRSTWLGAIGIYYFMIGLIRFMLLRSDRRIRAYDDDKRLYLEYISYRKCGILMFILDMVISIIAMHMVYQNKSYSYSGYTIYLTALYTFYYFITAIISVVSYGKRNRPILSAAKQLSLAAGWMSMYALQTAMLATFSEDAINFRRTMNTITGVCVYIYIIITAVRMIVHSTRIIRKLEQTEKV